MKSYSTLLGGLVVDHNPWFRIPRSRPRTLMSGIPSTILSTHHQVRWGRGDSRPAGFAQDLVRCSGRSGEIVACRPSCTPIRRPCTTTSRLGLPYFSRISVMCCAYAGPERLLSRIFYSLCFELPIKVSRQIRGVTPQSYAPPYVLGREKTRSGWPREGRSRRAHYRGIAKNTVGSFHPRGYRVTESGRHNPSSLRICLELV